MPRQSAAVYRRRRLVLLVGLVLLLAAVGVAVWLFVAQPWAQAADAPRPAPSTSAPAADPSATPTPDADPDADQSTPSAEATDPAESETPAIVACEAKDIVVAAVTDADTYAAGQMPQLSISLTNTGPVDCTMDVGSSVQALTVKSGSDVWWRSTDCQQEPSSMIATLKAGTTVTSKTPVTWDRTRSSVDTCTQENRQRAPGGGASYHVEVSIGGFASAMSTQILLQ